MGRICTSPDSPGCSCLNPDQTTGSKKTSPLARIPLVPRPRSGHSLAQTSGARMAGDAGELLRFDAVSKRFGGTLALDGVSFALGAGEIVALLGENGAGKSTLIKALAGIHTPDSGQILCHGAPYRHKPPRFGQRQSVAFIHQDLGLVEWMSIAENMALAIGYPRKNFLIDWRAAEATAARALAQVGCDIDPNRRVQELSRTEKSLVAIARALAVEADVLVLDEPSASLPADEVHRLFDALRPLKSRGVGMIYVSHRLDEVFEIADRVVVLRDGRLIGVRAVAATSPGELVEMIVGKKLGAPPPRPAQVAGPPLLSLRDLAAEGVGPVELDLARGEVLGLVGLRGAGHEQIGRVLFGCLPYTGDIELDEQGPDLNTPRQAMAAGIGLIARDRTEESVAFGLSIRENNQINPGAHGRHPLALRSPGHDARNAREVGARVGLRPNLPHLPIEALSGGNQQKVVVGRWLDIGGKLLIAEDPTAGVDVGAKSDIYALLDQALAAGLGVLVISTDFEEVARICHRALVFSRGRIVEELAGEALTTSSVIHAASVAQREAA